MCTQEPDWWLYVLRLANGRLYTGITTDVRRRLREHADGRRGSRAVRAGRPATLAAVWALAGADRGMAQAVEHLVKRCPRKVKLQLVRDPDRLAAMLVRKGLPVSARPEAPDG